MAPCATKFVLLAGMVGTVPRTVCASTMGHVTPLMDPVTVSLGGLEKIALKTVHQGSMAGTALRHATVKTEQNVTIGQGSVPVVPASLGPAVNRSVLLVPMALGVSSCASV
ncbi:hypothetical protein UPYG_G00273220 [Umbra pygmaea]|uniref:Antifreeze protein n=1 Tax=Umbra pygmaea TaxID=75934 RepID=A0ABD0WC32_UMBPY